MWAVVLSRVFHAIRIFPRSTENNFLEVGHNIFSKSSLLASLLLMTSLLLMVILLLLMCMLLLSSNAPALAHAVADIHAVAGVSSVVGRIVTCAHALALVRGTQDAVTGVSAVVYPAVANILAL
jgi:hypothetical protein